MGDIDAFCHLVRAFEDDSVYHMWGEPDPAREIVGVYLEVLLHMTEDFEPLWNFDLFQNAVTAAVAD